MRGNRTTVVLQRTVFKLSEMMRRSGASGARPERQVMALRSISSAASRSHCLGHRDVREGR